MTSGVMPRPWLASRPSMPMLLAASRPDTWTRSTLSPDCSTQYENASLMEGRRHS
ncbi:Uncharacterised protein [Bordetella pertussis]|nr:Uncharacterised protein [Bordetella pertussis]